MNSSWQFVVRSRRARAPSPPERPTNAPMLEPATRSSSIPDASSSSTTPMWAKARAPPPDRTIPTDLPVSARAVGRSVCGQAAGGPMSRPLAASSVSSHRPRAPGAASPASRTSRCPRVRSGSMLARGPALGEHEHPIGLARAERGSSRRRRPAHRPRAARARSRARRGRAPPCARGRAGEHGGARAELGDKKIGHPRTDCPGAAGSSAIVAGSGTGCGASERLWRRSAASARVSAMAKAGSLSRRVRKWSRCRQRRSLSRRARNGGRLAPRSEPRTRQRRSRQHCRTLSSGSRSANSGTGRSASANVVSPASSRHRRSASTCARQ